MIEIKTGEKIVGKNRVITQEIINEWADFAQDHNPLHVDPEYAKTTRFGGTIAHGPLTLTTLFHMLVAQFKLDFFKDSEVELKFKSPVRPGDTITAMGNVINSTLQPEGTNKIQIEAFCINQNGEKVIEAGVIVVV